MASCESRFVKIGVVFHALYFENEVGDPQFFCISDIGNSLSDCSQSMKKSVLQKFFARTSLKGCLAYTSSWRSFLVVPFSIFCSLSFVFHRKCRYNKKETLPWQTYRPPYLCYFQFTCLKLVYIPLFLLIFACTLSRENSKAVFREYLISRFWENKITKRIKFHDFLISIN